MADVTSGSGVDCDPVAANAMLARAELADENERLRNRIAALDARADRQALRLVREQRDALDELTALLPSYPGNVPCGDGRCYCGGCVL